MAKFILSAKAKSDIDSIWDYTCEKWSIEQAIRYFKFIQKEMHIIAENPYAGRSYHTLLPGYFGKSVKSHIIFYKIRTTDEIEIIRILHQKMDLKDKLKE